MNETKSRGPMPPDIRKRWEESLAAISRDEAEASFAKTRVAAAEDTFSGFVRRCVHRGGKPITTLVDEAKIDQRRLAVFIHGEGPLDSPEIDRLLNVLGVELVGSRPEG
jgi:hypothetical protein